MGALRLSRLSLGQRLLLALGAMLLPLVAVGIIGLLALHDADHDINALTGEFASKSRALSGVRRSLGRAESSAANYVRTGDPRMRARFFTAVHELNGRFDRIERFDGSQERRLARQSRRSWLKAAAIATRELRSRRVSRSGRPYPLRAFHPSIEEAMDSVENLAERARQDTVASRAATKSREQSIFTACLAIFALGAGPALFIGWRIHRSIDRPAARLREAAERVGAGNHGYRVVLEPADELGEVASAFNAMVEKVAASEEMLGRASKQDAVGQLASGIAHDFNNLLVVMLNSAHFVEAALPERDPARLDVKEIRRAAERATGLTRQLLSFSRPLSAPSDVLDLGAVVREMQPLLVRSIGENIELSVHLVNGLPPVKGDPAQLEQVLLNLALNARDAMPHGGRLTIATAAAHARPGEIASVRLSVSDTGHGMTTETAARALEPLFTTKPPGEGTGLGLATADRIVRSMRGQLNLSTQPGRGTVVTVELPSTADKSSARAPTQLDKRAASGETILLVEDDDAVRSLVQRILTRAGYVVLVTAYPKEALRLAARGSQQIDLVLSDVVMPVMSGPAMVEQMRSSWPDLRALFISGYPDSVMEVRRIRRDGFALLEKPFDPETLERRVRDALERPRGPKFQAAALTPKGTVS